VGFQEGVEHLAGESLTRGRNLSLIDRPMPTCLAMCPRDINIMLIGYEGGIVAYDFRQAMPVKTFEMTLPPGAPGGGTYDDANVSRHPAKCPRLKISHYGQNVRPRSPRSHGEQMALYLSLAIPTGAWHSGPTQIPTNP